MKIENRLSTLTNEIKENLSLLGDGLLTSRREILSCVPQKTHSQQAMTKVKYVLVPDVK
jgi:hypothetical protein